MEARQLSLRPQSNSFQVWLRIRHPKLDPAEISRTLQLTPEHCFKAGEARHSGSGLPSTSVHNESCWLGCLHPATGVSGASHSSGMSHATPGVWMHEVLLRDLGLAMNACILRLRRHMEFLQRIKAEGGQIDLRVALDPGQVSNFVLSPQYIGVLSELGVPVEFELGDR